MSGPTTETWTAPLEPRSGTKKPTLVIRAQRKVHLLDWHGLWTYRGLLYFLIWRDVKVRYKQTAIGIGWAMFQPVMTMIVFSLVFSRFAGVETGSIPYPLFAFAGLLPWSYFSQAVIRSAGSLVGEANLISKVYFPRAIVPIAAAVAPLIDFGLTLLALSGLLLWFGITPTARILTLPFFLLLAMAMALGMTLWLSALNARYRDVGHVIPFMIQLWMFASPVAYPISAVPEKWRLLYNLNPLVSVVEGFRWSLFGQSGLQWGALATSIVIPILMICTGLAYFSRTERFLVDIL
jgi:lipopolysaccharide transport system permease protein